MDKTTEIKIRGYHADFYGHVNNARYLEFLEEDRWLWLEQRIDLPAWFAKQLTFVAVNININYRRVLNVGDTITVTTRVERTTARTVVLLQEIVLQVSGEIVADAQVTFVIIDQHGRALPLEDERMAEIRRLCLT